MKANRSRFNLYYHKTNTPLDFAILLHSRYSCRSFSPQPISQNLIDRILTAGRIAPTAVNKQLVHVWPLTNPDTLQAIKSTTRSNYGTPLLLAVGCRPTEAWVRRYDRKNGAEIDAAIVATYLMLAAENEGLATLWVGSFDPALLKDMSSSLSSTLGIPRRTANLRQCLELGSRWRSS